MALRQGQADSGAMAMRVLKKITNLNIGPNTNFGSYDS